ncbi:hypothetical protein [Vibrio sp. TBV020]|uniref:hypothetical protein n=1 Tax=Vibrio sp. TBV020 TaxID=3137398 RepID=UPI0038CD80D5
MRWSCVLLSLLAFNLSANTLVLTEQPISLAKTIESSWQECDELMWCDDKLAYYRSSYFAQATVASGHVEIELMSEFSVHRFSQLQLNLRADGFSLQVVEVEGERFDVAKQLSTSTSSDVDAALVRFINRYSQQVPRTLTWQSTLWNAELISDGDVIALRFVSR